MTSWRFQGRFLHLTYKSFVDESTIRDMIEKKIKNRIVKIKMAHETSDEKHPYEHTHLLLFINKKIDKKNERCFDIGDIHPNINFIKTSEHYYNT